MKPLTWTVVEHTRDHRGTLYVYWDEDDLDEDGDLLCYCSEEGDR